MQPAPAIVRFPAASHRQQRRLFLSGRSLPAVIGIFFLLGLGLTFTPCVLPMVPILTSVVLGGARPAQVGASTVFIRHRHGHYVCVAGLTVGLLGAGATYRL